ncbi:MAG: hypothetical protein FJ134_00925 [Deltaproteobacteria bacterium]|nr:hypothetical protein [Deltaproteobacteria bacterium]
MKFTFKYSTWESPKNQCPYCAEETNNNQVRCDSCGERLIKSEPLNKYKENNSKLELIDITNGKIIIYSLIISLSVILLNYQLLKYYHKIANEDHFFINLMIYYLYYSSMAILIGYEIYKYRRAKMILIISFCFYLFPIILMALSKPYDIVYAIIDRIDGFVIVFAFPLFFINVFRRRWVRNDYEIITDNKDYSIGICRYCNETTKVGDKRFYGFIGKKQRYFCDNCGKFIMGDPFANILVGLSGIIIFCMIAIGYTLSYIGHQKINITDNLILFLMLIIAYDFLRRLIYSIIAIMKINR